MLIAERMLEAIKSGKYDIGGKLPSVRALVKRFGVSKETVGHAYCMLENAGYVQKIIELDTVCNRQRVSA